MAKKDKRGKIEKKTAKEQPSRPSSATNAKKASNKNDKKPLSIPRTMPKTTAQKPRHGGLGRGLDALIGAQATAALERATKSVRDEIASTIKSSTVQAAPAPAIETPTAPLNGEELIKVKTGLIQRSPWQPRGTFNQESLKELSETIKIHGLIQALTCRRIPESKGGGFELISGERRLRAAIEAGLEEVPVRILDVSDRDAAEMAIIENVQRDDLNAIEEAEGYQTLINQFNLTQQEVADRVGKGRASVAHSLRLLDLSDEVKQLVSIGQLSVGHAKVLLSLQDETEQVLLARKSVVEGLSVRALERSITKRQSPTPGTTSKVDIPESHAKLLLDKMHEYFGAPVRLKPSVTYANGKRSKGTFEVDFADNDELSRILALLGIEID